jgi:hypothetical protein
MTTPSLIRHCVGTIVGMIHYLVLKYLILKVFIENNGGRGVYRDNVPQCLELILEPHNNNELHVDQSPPDSCWCPLFPLKCGNKCGNGYPVDDGNERSRA